MSAFFKKNWLLFVIAAAIAAPLVVEAGGLLPACALDKGQCGLNDIVQTFINFGKLLLGFVGAAVLIFFIYGGFVWLTSVGSPEKVKKGKDIVVNSIIGLVIVFGAFMIVQFILQALGERGSQVGQACRVGESRESPSGILVPDPSNPEEPRCVISCGDDLLADAGYSCRNPDPDQSINCIRGLCPEGRDNVCCQPAASPAPTPAPAPAEIPPRCAARGAEYRCMNSREGTDCRVGLCPGLPAEIRCCKPRPAPEPAPAP